MAEENNTNLTKVSNVQALQVSNDYEISMLDIYMMFCQYKMLFFAILVSISVLGFGYAASIKPTYIQFMLVKVGGLDEQPFEGLEELVLFVENVFIPNALKESGAEVKIVAKTVESTAISNEGKRGQAHKSKNILRIDILVE